MPTDIVNIKACIASNRFGIVLAHGNNDLLSQKSLGSHFNLWFDHIGFDNAVNFNDILRE